MPLLLLTLLTLVVLAAIFLPPVWKTYRRKKIQQQPFPAAWRQILKHRMPYFRALPADLQLQLKKLIQVFVAEKQFVGCADLVVTDEMKVTIAAQACLLLLNKPPHYYPKLKQILIYPAAFVVPKAQSDTAGVVSEVAQVRLGESWQTGQIILSWVDTLKSAAICNDGHNLVIHEFAHQLDQLKGQATGAPLLSSTQAYKEWSLVLSREYEQLQKQLAEKEFKQGQIHLSELARVSELAANARIDFEIALNEYDKAFSALELLVGVSFDSLNQGKKP